MSSSSVDLYAKIDVTLFNCYQFCKKSSLQGFFPHHILLWLLKFCIASDKMVSTKWLAVLSDQCVNSLAVNPFWIANVYANILSNTVSCYLDSPKMWHRLSSTFDLKQFKRKWSSPGRTFKISSCNSWLEKWSSFVNVQVMWRFGRPISALAKWEAFCAPSPAFPLTWAPVTTKMTGSS